MSDRPCRPSKAAPIVVERLWSISGGDRARGHQVGEACPRQGEGFQDGLTCDILVTYMMNMDANRIFKALADPTRRLLLDRLYERDGQTLSELESPVEMTRFGVMKHLRQLESAGLVVTTRSGREKLHYLNPVPIRLVLERWIDKYTERRVSGLADLKSTLEKNR